MKRPVLAATLLLGFAASAGAATLLVEAESFAKPGGWVVDQQSIDVIGSSYLLAHGLGVPVADATTQVAVPEPGRYRVLVRTKDWVARWNAPGAPGRFQLLVDGKPLPETFGTRGRDWFWHDGGEVEIRAKKVTLALHDLTGFAGRCDAIVLSSDPAFVPPDDAEALAAFRRKALGLPDQPPTAGDYDVVVVGGGVAGCCAAVSSSRLGLKVALVQNRPVLGGNSSSEVRVWIQGRVQQQPYPAIGEIVEEMNTHPKVCPGPGETYGDDVKLQVVRAEKNVGLYLGQHVYEAETDGNRIRAVVAKDILTGRPSRYTGRWFVDATGDANLGALARADHEMTSQGHLGSSNLWYTRDTGKPAAFPRCPWALDLSDKPLPTDLKALGHWFWESGFNEDTIRNAEAIRDHNFRAMFGAWDCLKNVKKLYPDHKLEWAAFISGKRESRRLFGDVVLTQEDVLSGRRFPDGCFPATWKIDLHYPDPKYAAASPGNEFLAVAKFTPFDAPYWVPYRCLYSRNVANLFMAGRDVSVTHEALGTVRVMGTGGTMGEAVGRAAYLCKKHGVDPRGVYKKHLEEFRRLLARSTKPGGPKPRNGLIAYADAPDGPPGPHAMQQAQLYTIEPSGRNRRQLTRGPAGNFFPAWSPDGKQLAFVSVRHGGPAIWLVDGDDRRQRRLTEGLIPAWSPDGKRLAFVRPSGGGPQIWVIGADGAGEKQLTSEGANNVPTWSPRGDRIAFWSGDERGFGQVWVMDRDGAGRRQLTFPATNDYTPRGSSANAPAWLSSEKIVYWSGIEHQYGQVWTMDADGSNRRQLTTAPAPASSDNPAWSPDGTKILFDTQRRGKPEIWVMDADGSNQQVLIPDVKVLPGRTSWQPIPAADGAPEK